MNLAYVAGLIDGEGCIQFTRGRGNLLVPRVMIVNTDLGLLEDVQAAFGGRIVPLMDRSKAAWKRAYSWVITNKTAVEFVARIYRWLRVKRQQADVLFAWAAIRPGHGSRWTDDGREALALMKAQIHWLNWRGTGRPEQSPVDLVMQGK